MNILSRPLAVAIAALIAMICLGLLFPVIPYLIWCYAIGALILIGLAVIVRAIRTHLLDSSGAIPADSRTASGHQSSSGAGQGREKTAPVEPSGQSNNRPTNKW